MSRRSRFSKHLVSLNINLHLLFFSFIFFLKREQKWPQNPAQSHGSIYDTPTWRISLHRLYIRELSSWNLELILWNLHSVYSHSAKSAISSLRTTTTDGWKKWARSAKLSKPGEKVFTFYLFCNLSSIFFVFDWMLSTINWTATMLITVYRRTLENTS